MENLTFNIAQIEEAELLVNLVNVAYRPPQGKGGWTHEATLVAGPRTDLRQIQTLILLDKAQILVARHHEEIVGCVYVAQDGDQCHIGMLAVKPEFQSKGVGRVLFKYAEDYVIEHFNPTRIILLVVSDRPEIQNFYMSMGYQTTGQTMPYPIDAGVGIPKSDSLELIMLAKVPPIRITEALLDSL